MSKFKTVRTKKVPFTVKELRELPDDVVAEALSKLTKSQLEELQKDYKFWARPKQLPPEGDWKFWLLNCGRSFGKTWTGVQWVREQVKKGHKRIAAIAATNSDIERVMVKGSSGFLELCSKFDKTYSGEEMGFPEWSPTKRTLSWANGAKVEFYSAQEPERLRGPQFSASWCDELASWAYDEETWSMLQFTLRLGKNPQICITTTPRPTKLVRQLLKQCREEPERYKLTTGSSFENDDPSVDLTEFRNYEGTRLGRQELYAEVLEEAEGALWTLDILDAAAIKRKDVPDLARVVVSIDPAVTANKESDETGLIVVGMDLNKHCYILGDYTFKGSPQQWASKAIELYHKFEADRIVAEVNQGGDMVKTTIHGVDPTVPFKAVRASRGKYARAEPVSALYERGLVHHVVDPLDADATLEKLETQMTTWDPLGKIGSPDRIDSAVWGISDLALGGHIKPKIQLVYSNNKS